MCPLIAYSSSSAHRVPKWQRINELKTQCCRVLVYTPLLFVFARVSAQHTEHELSCIYRVRTSSYRAMNRAIAGGLIIGRACGRDSVPDLCERGRLREIEVRKLGAVEGGWANRRELGGDHERALKVGVSESAAPNFHERGRLRQVEARELPWCSRRPLSHNRPHPGGHYERALKDGVKDRRRGPRSPRARSRSTGRGP